MGGGGAGRLEDRLALLRSGVVRGVVTGAGVATGAGVDRGVGTLGFLARVGGTGLGGYGLLCRNGEDTGLAMTVRHRRNWKCKAAWVHVLCAPAGQI